MSAPPAPAARPPSSPPPRPEPAAAPVARLRLLGPNWYAAVMGTAAVASAGGALPGAGPGGPVVVRAACVAVWALAAAGLAALLVARAAHWARHGDQARRDLADPAVAPFYGCLAMALLAVGGATLSVGRDVVGVRAAVVLDAALWGAGTVVGLVVAAGVPWLMVARHRIARGSASPVWLLPVVAPMVSAALGPALVAHLPAGQGRVALLYACWAQFGMSLLATLALLPLVWDRLLHEGPLPPALAPTLFLVLGPLGQSTTAAGNLADAAQGAVGGAYARATAAFAVLYGVPVTGFALLWLALAGALLVGAWRRSAAFAMTWWGLTFPVGTCVTGAAGLARHTGLAAFDWLAYVLYALLVAAWLTAAARTGGGLARGTLPAAPAPAAP